VGTILVTIGGIISVVRRSKELPNSKLPIDMPVKENLEPQKVLVSK
jgi:hypothetical protein